MCVGSSHGGIHKMSLESICNARVQRRIRLENRHLGGSNLHAWLGLTWIGSRGRVAINWEMSRGLEVTARKGREKKEHHKLANWRPAALGHPFRCTVLWGPLPCQPFAYRTGIPGTRHLGRPQSRSRSRQERFVPCSSGGARPPLPPMLPNRGANAAPLSSYPPCTLRSRDAGTVCVAAEYSIKGN